MNEKWKPQVGDLVVYKSEGCEVFMVTPEHMGGTGGVVVYPELYVLVVRP